jgi:ribosomal 50S subunit-associated protein YjgA (DUF615 family)
MEPSHNLDTAKLEKLVEDIFAGGDKAVEEFDCSAYTEDELNYIVAVMQKQTTEDIDKLLESINACDEKEN